MGDGEVSIAGLDKADVLAVLFERSRPLGNGFMHYVPGPMPRETAEALVQGDGRKYFDYVQGRVMKVDLTGDSFDPWGYDRDNGPGAAAKAIASLRS